MSSGREQVLAGPSPNKRVRGLVEYIVEYLQADRSVQDRCRAFAARGSTQRGTTRSMTLCVSGVAASGRKTRRSGAAGFARRASRPRRASGALRPLGEEVVCRVQVAKRAPWHTRRLRASRAPPARALRVRSRAGGIRGWRGQGVCACPRREQVAFRRVRRRADAHSRPCFPASRGSTSPRWRLSSRSLEIRSARAHRR